MIPRCRSIVALALAFASSRSYAQAPKPEVQQSEARLKEGLELADKNRWNEARVAFTQAYSIRPSTIILWNIALSECEAGMPVDCLRHLREYARSSRRDADSMAALPEIANAANAKTGHIRTVANQVFVDGKPVPDRASTDEVIDVMPGQHEVRLERGTQSQTHTVVLQAGQWITLDLPKETAVPGSQLPTRESGWSTKTWLTVGFAGASVASFAVATGFGVAANGTKDDGERLRALPESRFQGTQTNRELSEISDRQHSQARMANGFLIGGAVLAAAAGIVWLWPSKNTQRPAFAASISPAGAGVQFAGSF